MHSYLCSRAEGLCPPTPDFPSVAHLDTSRAEPSNFEGFSSFFLATMTGGEGSRGAIFWVVFCYSKYHIYCIANYGAHKRMCQSAVNTLFLHFLLLGAGILVRCLGARILVQCRAQGMQLWRQPRGSINCDAVNVHFVC